jgi:hypothetical protein
LIKKIKLPFKNRSLMHADMVGNFLYFIVSGYKGDNCEIELNPCESNPCWNGGTCIKTGIDSYSCSCLVGECLENILKIQYYIVKTSNEILCFRQVFPLRSLV